jgi:hypothetical protein
MAYFQDLTPHGLSDTGRPPVLHVGWLDRKHPFPTGETSEDFRQKFGQMCRKPYRAYFGYHGCEFCKGKDRPDCNVEILVSGADAMYLAPTLIEHYVIDHGYLPPPAFIAAVLASPDEMQPENSDTSVGSHV